MSNNNPNAKVAAVESPEIVALRAQIKAMEQDKLKLEAQLKAQPVLRVEFKVSEKGAISVYGMGRFPITLYREQWETLLSDPVATSLKTFMANATGLKTRAQKQAEAAEAKAKADEAARLARIAAAGMTGATR